MPRLAPRTDRHALATGLCVGVLASVVGVAALFGPSGDAFLRWSYDAGYLLGDEWRQPPPEDLAIVAIDDHSLRELGQSPLQPVHRGIQVALLERLGELGAKAVVFDVVFDTEWPEPAVDEAFAAAMRGQGDVFLAAGVLAAERSGAAKGVDVLRTEIWAPTAELRRAARGWGIASLALDADYGARRLLTRLPPLEMPVYTWTAAASLHPQAPLNKTTIDDPRWIHYPYSPGAIPRFSMVQVLMTGDLPPDALRNRIVFVGSQSVLGYSGSERDTFRVPLAHRHRGSSFADGVAIHAVVFDNLRTGEWLTPMGRPGQTALICACGFCFALLLVASRPALAVAGAAACAVAWTWAALLYSRGAGVHFAWLIPITIQLPVSLAGNLVAQYGSEVRRRMRLKRSFSAYLSPVMVNRMVDSGEEPALSGEEMEITAFFSDVVGFSTFSEKLPSGRLVTLMNRYLGAMTTILQEESGTLDKYIGDAVVGMFGAPVAVQDHALRACTASLRMRDRLVDLRRSFAEDPDYDWPPEAMRLDLRIGLNTGLATVGNMGSEVRFNYTMMGDMVNLAARCESAAKQYGIDLLATGETVASAQAADAPIRFRRIDRVRVVGRTTPADLYEIFDYADRLQNKDEECLATFATGLDLLDRGDFKTALHSFESSIPLERRARIHPEAATPSRALAERCRQLIRTPPTSWDGVWTLDAK